jgi:hypothetical protein
MIVLMNRINPVYTILIFMISLTWARDFLRSLLQKDGYLLLVSLMSRKC